MNKNIVHLIDGIRTTLEFMDYNIKNGIATLDTIQSDIQHALKQIEKMENKFRSSEDGLIAKVKNGIYDKK